MNNFLPLLIASAGIMIIGSIVIYFVESGHPDSQIDSMIDAIWWTVATVTTVGYGDVVPVTDAGKVVAIVYMFSGIGILAIFISVLGTHFYKKRFEKDEKQITHGQKVILERLNDLERNQAKLQKDLRDLIEKSKEKN